jgi:hypothetical protein
MDPLMPANTNIKAVVTVPLKWATLSCSALPSDYDKQAWRGKVATTKAATRLNKLNLDYFICF